MAVTGTFLADFDSFNDAVQESEVKLRSFEAGAEKVEAQLSAMTDSFSGRKIVQDATLMAEVFQRAGGASAFTRQELERMGSVGQQAMLKLLANGKEVPPAIQAIAAQAKDTGLEFEKLKSTALSIAGAFGVTFSIGAVVAFGQTVLNTADDLVKISDKTHLFIDDVQRLQYVGGQTGNTVDQLSGAIGKMQVQLGDAKGQQAIRDLNLDLAEIKASNPYEQFQQIAQAIGSIKDPTDQAEAAIALFGRNGLEILPTLRAEFKKLSDQATVSGDAQVRAVDAAGDALLRQKDRVVNFVVGQAGNFALLAEKVGLVQAALTTLNPSKYAAEIGEIAVANEASAKAAQQLATEQKKTVDVLALYRTQLEGMKASTADLSSEQKDLITQAFGLGQSTNEIATAMNLAIPVVTIFTDALKEQAAAEKKAAAEAETAAKQRAKITADGAIQTAKIREDIEALNIAASGTADDAKLAAIEATFQKEVLSIKETGAAWQAHYDALREKADLTAKQVGSAWDSISATSREALQQQADAALEDFNRMLYSGLTFNREVLDAQLAKYHQLQDAARGMGSAVTSVLAETTANAKAANEEFMKLNQTVNSLAESYTMTFDSLEEVLAAEGLSDSVRASLVSYFEKQNKTAGGANDINPANKVNPTGTGSRVAPTVGTMAGGGMVNNFYVNGTAADVAAKIEQELVRKAKLSGTVGGRR